MKYDMLLKHNPRKLSRRYRSAAKRKPSQPFAHESKSIRHPVPYNRRQQRIETKKQVEAES